MFKGIKNFFRRFSQLYVTYPIQPENPWPRSEPSKKWVDKKPADLEPGDKFATDFGHFYVEVKVLNRSGNQVYCIVEDAKERFLIGMKIIRKIKFLKDDCFGFVYLGKE